MSEWTFRDYLRPLGRNGGVELVNDILEWTLNQPKKAQAKMDMIILSLQASPVWPPQYISALTGWPNILELRVSSFGAEYRPLGCHGPERREFTLLRGSIEKGGKLPRADCQTATDRRKRVFEGWPTCEHEFTRSDSRKA
ncbi:MAG: type II toxin-antitoxin system RelE/ParE family toxin [Nitrososphaerales archaeon]